eukprot:3995822-Amphidinium_carterae.1
MITIELGASARVALLPYFVVDLLLICEFRWVLGLISSSWLRPKPQKAIPNLAGAPGACLLYTSPSPRDRG